MARLRKKVQEQDNAGAAVGADSLDGERAEQIRGAVITLLEEGGAGLDESGAPTLAALEERLGWAPTADEAVVAYNAVRAEIEAGLPPEAPPALRPALRASRVPVPPRAGQKVWTGRYDEGRDGRPGAPVMRGYRQFPTTLYQPGAAPGLPTSITARNALEYERALDQGYAAFEDFPPAEREAIWHAATAAPAGQ